MQTRLFGGTNYFTRAQLEASNCSRKDGIDAVAESKWRSTTSRLVKAAIKTLKTPEFCYEAAMTYIHRFFLTRSIKKNDRHLVVGGAILLASKVNESPRSVQDVAYVLLQLKNNTKQKPQQGPDQTALEQFKEGVVLAEQAILFSLNFNLNVEPHVGLVRRLLEPFGLAPTSQPPGTPTEESEASHQLKMSVLAAVMFFLNDSALTSLPLQYPNSIVAPVALIMAAKRIAATRYADKGLPVPEELQAVLAIANDAEWFDSKGLSLETAADIEAQINELYASAQPPAPQQQQPAPAQEQAAPEPQAHAAAAQQQQQAAARAAPSVGPASRSAPAGRSLPAVESPEEGEVLAADTCGEPSTVAVTNALLATSSAQVPTAAAGDSIAPCASSGAAAGGFEAAECRSPSRAASAVAGHRNAAGADGGARMSATACSGMPRPQQLALPLPHQPARKRVSDSDDCCRGDEQATSGLHAAPDPQLDAEAEAADAGALAAQCRGYDGMENSANEYNSPNGLTNGNASGSGCGLPEEHAEVCSRPDALPEPGDAQQRVQRSKRARSEDGGALDAGLCCQGAVAKSRRLELEQMPVQMQP